MRKDQSASFCYRLPKTGQPGDTELVHTWLTLIVDKEAGQ